MPNLSRLNYYNEIDPFAAGWIKRLIQKGEIPKGVVDTRSIVDVDPVMLARFNQCHFFAGVAGWSYALKLAEWPVERPIWTGSCPCQSFSTAGNQKGTSDERHLWPVFFDLIKACNPQVVMGEQVSSELALGWLDGVKADLESVDYDFASFDLPASAAGAFHIRQRLVWVGSMLSNKQPATEDLKSFWKGYTVRKLDLSTYVTSVSDGQAPTTDTTENDVPVVRPHVENTKDTSWERTPCSTGGTVKGGGYSQINGSGTVGVCDTSSTRLEGDREAGELVGPPGREATNRHGAASSESAGVEAATRSVEVLRLGSERHSDKHSSVGGSISTPSNSIWESPDWLLSREGRWRPVQPGSQPMVNGVPQRMGRLCGYGNAISPQVVAEVVKAYINVEK